MAPRRGGGGYSSGGSSSCEYCTETTYLPGYDWQYPLTTALFAMRIILLIILIACMVLTRRFKWIRERGTDKLRNSGYLTAAIFMFLSTLLGVIFTALGESRVEVTYLVYIGYMIKDIFYQVANVLIVAIIARTITEDVGALSQKLTSFGIGFLWTISLIVLGFDIAVYAEYLAIGGAEEIAGRGFIYSSMVLASYLFAFTLVLSALAVFAVLKGRSMGSLLMLIIVMPSLFLTTLLELVTEAVTNFRSGRPTKSSYDLIYANLYISVLAIMAIFLTVALIGGLRQRHSDASGLTQEQKLAQTGPHYVAVGPYAPPTAPYNPHGTQFYSPPVYGGQQMQYAPYAAPGQFATQQQQAEVSNTPAPAVAKTASPVQYAAPVAVSPSPYGAPSSSSVSPPPQHDPYQAYTQQQPQQQQHQ